MLPATVKHVISLNMTSNRILSDVGWILLQQSILIKLTESWILLFFADDTLSWLQVAVDWLLDLVKTDDNLTYHLGCVYGFMGNFEEAERILKWWVILEVDLFWENVNYTRSWLVLRKCELYSWLVLKKMWIILEGDLFWENVNYTRSWLVMRKCELY